MSTSDDGNEGTDTCAFPDCGRAAQSGGYCWGHAKQRSLGRPLSPLRDATRTPAEVLADAALRYADADTTDEAEFRRARDLLHKSAASFVHRCGAEELRAALGIRVGRPRKVTDEAIRRAIETTGSTDAAARLLGIGRSTLYRRRGGNPER